MCGGLYMGIDIKAKKEKLKIIIKNNYRDIVIFIFLYAVLLLPYIISSTNTIPSADDFSFANAIKEYRVQSDNYFLALCKFVKSRWFTWSGRWLGGLFPSGLHPLVISDNPYVLLEIEMAISVLIFVFSFAILIDSILKYIFSISSIKTRNIFILLSIFTILNTEIYSEIFYWYTGVIYICMVGSELLTFALMLRYFENIHRKWITVLFSIIGFYTCNGLQAIVPVFLVYVVAIICKYRQEKRIYKQDCVIFILFLTSALLSVCAPGNFARHSVIDSTGVHFIKASIYTCNNLITLSIKLLSNPAVIGLMTVFFCLGVHLFLKHGSFKINLLVTSVFFVLLMFGMMFPVSLGYSSSSIPNRILFMFAVHFLICVCIMMIFGGNYAAKYMGTLRKKRDGIYMILVLFFLSHIFLSGWFQQSPYYVTTENICNDERVHDQWIVLLNSIESDKGAAVQIDSSAIAHSPVLKDVGISTDSSSWINQAIAQYYGKESVALISN